MLGRHHDDLEDGNASARFDEVSPAYVRRRYSCSTLAIAGLGF